MDGGSMNMHTLDVSDYEELGKHLAKKIEQAVLDTQIYIVRDLPNELRLTNDQFESLMKAQNQTSYMTAVDGLPSLVGKVEKAYIFYTPFNAMDVVVVDKPSKTLLENL